VAKVSTATSFANFMDNIFSWCGEALGDSGACSKSLQLIATRKIASTLIIDESFLVFQFQAWRKFQIHFDIFQFDAFEKFPCPENGNNQRASDND
jgi:hypothetical protein